MGTKSRNGTSAKTKSLRNATVDEMKGRLRELEETFDAIRSGAVDALVISSPKGDRVFTIEGAEHPYRTLVETIEEGAATLSEEGTVLYANRSFARIFGVPLERCIGSSLREFVTAENQETLRKLVSGGREKNVRGELKLSMGQANRTVRLSLNPIKRAEKPLICAVATEMTELLQANESLRATELSLRNLSGRLLQLQDEERRRIARDLHDITGQKIAAAAMSLNWLEKHSSQSGAEVRGKVRECNDLVRSIGDEVRTLSYLLHPPLLDECGLSSALMWYAEGFEKRSGVEVKLDVPPNFPRLCMDAETALFRVVQESLTNVHRYSGGSDAQIRIRAEGKEVLLEVVDHGKGIPANNTQEGRGAVRSLGVGIPGMRERIRQLGGSLEVESDATGTRVTAILPVEMVPAETVANHANGNGTAASRILGARASGEGVARRTVLVADDHEVMRRGVVQLIETQQEFAVVGEAMEGREAIAKTKELHPDIVILDVNMPGLGGLNAATQILRECPETKILFFTVHDSRQVVREILNVGAHGYLSKARAGSDLLDAVRTVLSGQRFFPEALMVKATN
ncbi:MAG TPA: response regulator [Candidatus Acidoferrales bacterium]|nr:response regulator [Candidatus Acidoferrales bacterium]